MKSASASVPSNIALIKYWGKRERARQWPCNDSLSMTLSTSRTHTTATVMKSSSFEVFVGEHQLFPSDPFAKKIFSHLKFLSQQLGYSDGLRIDTANTFPASCGIASSASGMAALTLAAVAAWTGAESLDQLADCGFNIQKLATLARAGSGSACRSLLGGFVAWHAGDDPLLQNIEQIAAADHWELADIIVMVSQKAKSTSSSSGHELATTSPLFAPRVAVIRERMRDMVHAIGHKDFHALGTLLETDALDMHAVMMTSRPPLHYFTDVTSEIIAWVREQRQTSTLKAYVTIDAGPNPHIICPKSDCEALARAIATKFPQCEYLIDFIGSGPVVQRAVAVE